MPDALPLVTARPTWMGLPSVTVVFVPTCVQLVPFADLYAFRTLFDLTSFTQYGNAAAVT
jgi:hypothetical protein